MFHNGQLSQQQSLAALLVVKVRRRIQDAAAYVKLANESVTLETIKSAGGFVFSMRNDVDVLLVIFDCSVEITKPEERACFNNGLAPLTGVRPRLLSV